MVKCKICSSNTTTINDKQFDILYYQCNHCEFIQMDENKIVSFSDERKEYDLHENSILNTGYVNMFQDFLNTSVIPFKQTGKLLDFGSGPEPVLVQLINRDYDFDTMNYDIHYQPEKVYIDNIYDVITSTEVIEHLSNPIKVFKLFYDLLDDNGILAIMTLLNNNNTASFLKWWYRRDVTHITFYTLKTMQILADITGFKLIHSDKKRKLTFKKC